jgi:hypothetical protein
MLNEKNEDYKYAYSELKKFWNENVIDKNAFETVFGKELFELKENEDLVAISTFIFSVSFDDDNLSYKVGKIFELSQLDKNTLNFEEYKTSLLDSQIEWGVQRIEEDREKVYHSLKNLIDSMTDVTNQIKDNLEKIKGVK